MSRITTNVFAPPTSDKDLMELAGYHAYMNYDVRTKLKINDSNYTVLNTKNNGRDQRWGGKAHVSISIPCFKFPPIP